MAFLLAALSGLLLFVAFPPFTWWPLVFVAHVPLLVALEGQSGRRRFLLGLTTGTVFICTNQYCIAGTMMRMSSFPLVAAHVALLAYALHTGLQWAIFSWAYAPIRRWSGRAWWVLTVPLLFAATERLYPMILQIFLCSPLYEAPILLQASEVIGPSGITWMVFFVTVGVLRAIEERAQKRTSDHFVITAAVALWFMFAVFGVVRMRQVWDAPVRGRPTVALVQPNVTVAEKTAKNPQARAEVYKRTVAMTEKALQLRPQLVVWPEGGFPFPFEINALDLPRTKDDTYGRVLSRKLYALAARMPVDFVAGSLRRVGDRIRNGALFFPRGELTASTYDKRLLLMFGERLPFGDMFPALAELVPNMAHHEAGSRFEVFEAAGFNIVPSICYEAIQPHFTRESLEATDGDVILNLTNDVWFGGGGPSEQHLMVQTQRAIENRVWLIRSTNSGISAFVDPTGTIRSRTADDEETILALEVPIPALGKSFYRRFGDVVFIAGCLLGIGFLVGRNRRALLELLRRRSVR